MKSGIVGLSFLVLVAFIAQRLWHSEDVVAVHCETSKGPLELVVNPEWSPRGAERFLRMVDDGFVTNIPLARCIAGFVCQFGMVPGGYPIEDYAAIPDDVPRADLRHFNAGYLSFAGLNKDSRTAHVFIALAPVASLGTQPWETPFGYIRPESMAATVARFETSYGELAPIGHGPDPAKLQDPDGVTYLNQEFPKMDWILRCGRAP